MHQTLLTHTYAWQILSHCIPQENKKGKNDAFKCARCISYFALQLARTVGDPQPCRNKTSPIFSVIACFRCVAIASAKENREWFPVDFLIMKLFWLLKTDFRKTIVVEISRTEKDLFQPHIFSTKRFSGPILHSGTPSPSSSGTSLKSNGFWLYFEESRENIERANGKWNSSNETDHNWTRPRENRNLREWAL